MRGLCAVRCVAAAALSCVVVAVAPHAAAAADDATDAKDAPVFSIPTPDTHTPTGAYSDFAEPDPAWGWGALPELTAQQALQLSAAEFEERFLARGQPVVIRGAAASWRALRPFDSDGDGDDGGWDVRWFAQRVGDHRVQVRSRANAQDGDTVVANMTMEGYVDALEGGTAPPASYFSWVNNDRSLHESSLRRYLGDLPYIRGWGRTSRQKWHPEWMYFGTRGGGVPRHIDAMCNAKLSVQISGRKRWLLSPGWTEALPVPSQLATHGLVLTTVLEPGDALVFYPEWWHETATLSPSSLSYNTYIEWEGQSRSSKRQHRGADNAFLREVRTAARYDETLTSFYGSCWQTNGGEGSDDSVDDLAAKYLSLCAEPGAAAAAGPAITAICGKFERDGDKWSPAAIEAATAMARAALRSTGGGDNNDPPAWAVADAGEASGTEL